MELLIRSIRFLYLLWGGLLLGALITANRMQIPSFIKQWTWLAYCLFISPWGRGLFIGIAIVMLLAAIGELWELIDKILKKISRNTTGK